MSARHPAAGPPIQTAAATGKSRPIIGCALSLTGGLAGATQYFAHEFDGQAALGSHFSGIYPDFRNSTLCDELSI